MARAMVDLPEPDSPPDRKSPLEDLEADVVAGAHVLAAAREDGILGDELQIHVLHPQQRAFIGALVLTLAEPVGLEIDAGIRRTGILDIGDQGKRTSLTSERGTAEMRLRV